MKMKSDSLGKWILIYGVMLTPVLSVTKVIVKNRSQSVREKRDAEIIETDFHIEKFLIPKPLKDKDEITVQGNLTNGSKWITVSLVMHNDTTGSADESNVACQVLVSFIRPDHNDSISLRSVVDGYPHAHGPSGTTVEMAFEEDELNFSISFFIQEESNEIYIELDNVALDGSCKLHELHSLQNIKYLTLGGHMSKEVDLMFLLA